MKVSVAEKKSKFPRKHSVLGIFEILPEEVDEDLDALIEKVDAYLMENWRAYVESYSLQEVAFGLKKIIAKIDMPEDIVGGTEPVEIGIMEKVPGIQRAECGMVSRT
jgi:translation elongation factor EF-1beta